MRSLERTLLLLAALCLILLILVNGRPYFTNATRPPRGIQDPHVALQMARSVEEVDAILGDAPSPDREVMRIKQYIDFAFIASYAAVFVVVSRAVTPTTRWAWVIGVCGALAAFQDARENVDILRLLDTPLRETTQGMLSHLRVMSSGKWVSEALAMAALGVVTRRSRRWYLRLIAGVELAAPALMLWGLIYNAGLVWVGLLLDAALISNAATLKFLLADIANYESATRSSIPRTVRQDPAG